jgi:16S rRNA (guanine(966)-N(2))-methyltransferase RsmD
MRIIGGENRGRRIKYPGEGGVRPTKDRIRGSVFNMIAECVPGTRVLDLFSGSGAYGLEALSRGAESVSFIDNNKESIRVIRENCRGLGLHGSVKFICQDVFKALGGLANNKERFDLIFSDPPFNKGMAKKTLIMINQYDILNRPGLFIVEHSCQETLPEEEEGNCLSVLKQKTYKNILITIFLKK